MAFGAVVAFHVLQAVGSRVQGQAVLLLGAARTRLSVRTVVRSELVAAALSAGRGGLLGGALSINHVAHDTCHFQILGLLEFSEGGLQL